jgi:hypothetical protein
MSRRRDHCDQEHHVPRVTPGGHRLAVSAGLDPFQREHELADAIVTLMIGASRYGSKDDDGRLDLLAHVTLLVAHTVAERVRDLRGIKAGAAFRKALGRRAVHFCRNDIGASRDEITP